MRLIGSAEHVDELRAAGLDAMAVDPRAAEAVTDYEVEGRDRLHRGLQDLLGRGNEQRADLERHIAAFAPDVLLIDTIAYGAAIGAEKSGLPWASVMPSLIPFPGKGIPPYGLGLKPMRGPLGWARDKALFPLVVLREYTKAMLPRLNALRADAGLAPARQPDREPVPAGSAVGPRRATPLEYPRVDTPAHVRFVGAQLWDPPVETPAWLDEAGRPAGCWSRCSTEYQGDERLAAAAIEALRDEPVRVLVTLADAHGVGELPTADNVRVERFVAAWPGAGTRRGGRLPRRHGDRAEGGCGRRADRGGAVRPRSAGGGTADRRVRRRRPGEAQGPERRSHQVRGAPSARHAPGRGGLPWRAGGICRRGRGNHPRGIRT